MFWTAFLGSHESHGSHHILHKKDRPQNQEDCRNTTYRQDLPRASEKHILKDDGQMARTSLPVLRFPDQTSRRV